ESGFPGYIAERPALRIHAARPVNTNSLAFLITVLLLFTVLNSPQMSPNFLIWLVVGVFLMATTLRMYATCQQLQDQARAHAAAASGLLGHTELHLQMPAAIAFSTRGRLHGLRLQLALLDREFDDLEEINALPVHNYKIPGTKSEALLQQQGSSSGRQDAKMTNSNTKTASDGLTCTVCLEQVNQGELVRTLPCLHQFHVNCIDPWLRQQGTCPICKFRVSSEWQARRQR
uniref:RING-type E3 ubiquitin transferase n=1 Tax=Kalanchoe fedtschenkoi TaxID=63787 RepID=A0A7N0TDD1_KALFE